MDGLEGVFHAGEWTQLLGMAISGTGINIHAMPAAVNAFDRNYLRMTGISDHRKGVKPSSATKNDNTIAKP